MSLIKRHVLTLACAAIMVVAFVSCKVSAQGTTTVVTFDVNQEEKFGNVVVGIDRAIYRSEYEYLSSDRTKMLKEPDYVIVTGYICNVGSESLKVYNAFERQRFNVFTWGDAENEEATAFKIQNSFYGGDDASGYYYTLSPESEHTFTFVSSRSKLPDHDLTAAFDLKKIASFQSQDTRSVHIQVNLKNPKQERSAASS